MSKTCEMFFPCSELQGFHCYSGILCRLPHKPRKHLQVHLDLDDPATEQASQRPPLTLKLKRPFVTTNLSFICLGKEVTYIWRPSDRALVNVNRAHMLNP